jgi:signal transduction histidine kinase
VVGDLDRIEEIVTNLAINALKFSGGRPITIGLRHGGIDRQPPWHRVVPEPGADAAPTSYVEVCVTDRGEGIRADDLRRLFVAFQQLDGSSTRRRGGTGLGLAISARLAAAMHGHIAVNSTPGVGSTFALLLPAAPQTAARPGIDGVGQRVSLTAA